MSDLDRSRSDAIAHHRAGVKGALLVEYRCRVKKCLLLQVWQTPTGPEFFARCQRRAGDGLWLMVASGERIDFSSRDSAAVGIPKIWAGRLDDHPPTRWVPVMCNHHRGGVEVSAIRRDISDGIPGSPGTMLLPLDTPT